MNNTPLTDREQAHARRLHLRNQARLEERGQIAGLMPRCLGADDLCPRSAIRMNCDECVVCGWRKIDG